MEPEVKTTNTMQWSRRTFGAAAAASALIGFTDGSRRARADGSEGLDVDHRTGRAMVNGPTMLFPIGDNFLRARNLAEPMVRSTPIRPEIVYVSTQSETGILVYEPGGRLLKTIANQYPEVHSLYLSDEGGEEYFYATVQKGTPAENWLVVKMKTDGTVVQKITAPSEAGFKAPNEWRVTAVVPGPDGSIYVANGYGDSRIFKFDKRGNYLSSFAGKGTKTENATVATDWRLIPAMSSRFFSYAIGKTSGSAISTMTASLSAT